jgi:hypothetical protein
MKRLLHCVFRLLLLLALSLQAEWVGAGGFDPLFASNTTLQIMLDGPFALIEGERDKNKEYPGNLTYSDADGKSVVLAVVFQARGNFRLRKDVCRNSPLWLNVKTREAQGTLFENQNKIKLAVQCSPRPSYADYLFREYQAYRLFGQLTDRSFATRLVQVTYRDSGNARRSGSTLGFFIEHHARLAQRLGLNDSQVEQISLGQLDPVQANLVDTFMYMIANTDYSMLVGEDGEDCCHNIRPLKDNNERYVPIPFDFDFSGFVNAPYAEPPPGINLSSIRQRRYRGFCVHNNLSEATLARFRKERSAITAILADTSYVSPQQAAKAKDFIDGFYAVINNPAKVNSELLDACR